MFLFEADFLLFLGLVSEDEQTEVSFPTILFCQGENGFDGGNCLFGHCADDVVGLQPRFGGKASRFDGENDDSFFVRKPECRAVAQSVDCPDGCPQPFVRFGLILCVDDLNGWEFGCLGKGFQRRAVNTEAVHWDILEADGKYAAVRCQGVIAFRGIDEVERAGEAVRIGFVLFLYLIECY